MGYMKIYLVTAPVAMAACSREYYLCILAPLCLSLLDRKVEFYLSFLPLHVNFINKPFYLCFRYSE